MAENARSAFERLAREALEARSDGSHRTWDEAVAAARAAQARALSAATDDARATAWLEAWAALAGALADWDDAGRDTRLPSDVTLPPLIEPPRPTRRRLRRFVGAHYPIRSIAARIARRAIRLIPGRRRP